jgi:hypothetical protein
VSKEDYVRTFEPLIDGARREGRRLRLLYELGPDFEGFTAGAAWEDAKLGFRSLRLFDGCAIVTDAMWLRDATRFVGFMMPCPVKSFAIAERHHAIEWLSSLPEGTAASHRLLPDVGVIVVEVKQALRAQDFDALALTADAWIEAHGHLEGLVIHAREFPGWENLGSLIRHVQFVRDHQRKIRRIALVADTKLVSLAPRFAEHFIEAEIKTFGYDDLHNAIAWAGAR